MFCSGLGFDFEWCITARSSLNTGTIVHVMPGCETRLKESYKTHPSSLHRPWNFMKLKDFDFSFKMERYSQDKFLRPSKIIRATGSFLRPSHTERDGCKVNIFPVCIQKRSKTKTEEWVCFASSLRRSPDGFVWVTLGDEFCEVCEEPGNIHSLQ